MAALACALAACGGNVVVDGANANSTRMLGATGGASSGTSTGAGAAGAGSAGGATSTGTGIEVPDGGTPACFQDYYNLVHELQDALGCTPTATFVQCTGALLLHDPCGCLHVANDGQALPPFVMNDQSWMQCVSDGCCGPTKPGCGVCPPTPTQGHCDSFTSQCLPGP